MHEKQQKRISKFLSLILRHNPGKVGIKLDKNGWVKVDELLLKINTKGIRITFEELEFIVDTNNKKRFGFNEDKSMIRANQGHSVEIDLGYEAKIPPTVLYHGTGEKYVNSILESGIQKRNRHHVHLSKDVETAKMVGQRHGKPFIFEILTEAMVHDGFVFFESKNGVWLTEEIPVNYLKRSDKNE
ncbi:MAG: RNA 2'-phosphotransferase [Flavobacteriales bacterium]|nr:RNA 2'-phosphotransferase [Flavobacteriales bacterium]